MEEGIEIMQDYLFKKTKFFKMIGKGYPVYQMVEEVLTKFEELITEVRARKDTQFRKQLIKNYLLQIMAKKLSGDNVHEYMWRQNQLVSAYSKYEKWKLNQLPALEEKARSEDFFPDPFKKPPGTISRP